MLSVKLIRCSHLRSKVPPEHVDGVHADASEELGNADAPVTVMMMVLRMSCCAIVCCHVPV